jgi:sulfur carrier protein ThiS
MRISVKLYATLGDYLPPGAERNVATVDVPEGSTVQAVIESLKLPAELVHLVLVNGSYIAPETRTEVVLQGDDALAVWPPVAGG